MAVTRNFERRKRDKGNKKKYPFVIIGCEGNSNNKTEKTYFTNFISRKCIIKFSKGNSTDPVGIVEDLLSFIKNEIELEDDDKVYAVFDTDVNPEKQQLIDEAKKLAKENGVEIITSTPSFELWFLLHFGYTTKMFTSNNDLQNEFMKHIENYSKNGNTYRQIKDMTEQAIEDAKRLEKYQIENGQALDNVNCNPYTAVYKVVEELIKRNNS